MNRDLIKKFLIDLGESVQTACRDILRTMPVAQRIKKSRDSDADVIYQMDEAIESIIVEAIEDRSAEIGGVVLIAEGISDNHGRVFPKDANPEKTAVRMIMDPIDGTRGLMFNKRSAFFLAGAAENKGPQTRLSDIQCAVMAELPTDRAACGDILWAVRGQGCEGKTIYFDSGKTVPVKIQPSQHESLSGGFAQVSRFFPPGKELLARIEERFLKKLFPDGGLDTGEIFEDQYISTGGQFYEMLTGKDRFIADIRPVIFAATEIEGLSTHPYDMAAMLIAEEGGIKVTDGYGKPLDAPFSVDTPISWVAYANETLQKTHQPVFLEVLKELNLIK